MFVLIYWFAPGFFSADSLLFVQNIEPSAPMPALVCRCSRYLIILGLLKSGIKVMEHAIPEEHHCSLRIALRR